MEPKDNTFGVKVKTIREGSSGYIIRRLDAASYEIILDNDEVVILSPNQFKEIENEKK